MLPLSYDYELGGSVLLTLLVSTLMRAVAVVVVILIIRFIIKLRRDKNERIYPKQTFTRAKAYTYNDNTVYHFTVDGARELITDYCERQAQTALDEINMLNVDCEQKHFLASVFAYNLLFAEIYTRISSPDFAEKIFADYEKWPKPHLFTGIVSDGVKKFEWIKSNANYHQMTTNISAGVLPNSYIEEIASGFCDIIRIPAQGKSLDWCKDAVAKWIAYPNMPKHIEDAAQKEYGASQKEYGASQKEYSATQEGCGAAQEGYATAQEGYATAQDTSATLSHIVFKVVGVTFMSGKKSRQELLRSILLKKAPYDGDLDVTLEPYEFEGEAAIGVYVNGDQIGNVPRDSIYATLFVLQSVVSTSVRVIGGGIDKKGESMHYGAEITLTFVEQPAQ